MSLGFIERVESPEMEALTSVLAEQAPELEAAADAWPARQLQQCAEAGVYAWFLESRWGGVDWPAEQIMAGYLELSAACLTTTFVITQRMGACKRIAGSGCAELAEELLPDLIAGRTFATVGISHLTTSRRHLSEPVLKAREDGDHFVLDGYSPWVTGAPAADYVVLGAQLDDGRQILAATDMRWPGVTAKGSAQLMALTASQTGPVMCEGVRVPNRYVLAGPTLDVMGQGGGANTGGLQTSVLAAGLARAASRHLRHEAVRRPDLLGAAHAFNDDVEALSQELIAAARDPGKADTQGLRRRANSLALRSTQAALAAVKGAGYVAGHPVGRWCREAMFFLVWSCPQPVLDANLCELAGVESF